MAQVVAGGAPVGILSINPDYTKWRPRASGPKESYTKTALLYCDKKQINGLFTEKNPLAKCHLVKKKTLTFFGIWKEHLSLFQFHSVS